MMRCSWEGNRRPGGKYLPPGGWFMVACGLTACTPGSSQCIRLAIEYGKPLPLPYCEHDCFLFFFDYWSCWWFSSQNTTRQIQSLLLACFHQTVNAVKESSISPAICPANFYQSESYWLHQTVHVRVHTDQSLPDSLVDSGAIAFTYLFKYFLKNGPILFPGRRL